MLVHPRSSGVPRPRSASINDSPTSIYGHVHVPYMVVYIYSTSIYGPVHVPYMVMYIYPTFIYGRVHVP